MDAKQSPAAASTFIEELRKKHGLNTAQARDIFQTFLDTIESSLKNDRDVLFNRIGSIRVQKQKEKVSVIPRTAQKILLSERRHIKFDVSPVIMKEVNEGAGRPRTYKTLTEEEAQQYTKKHNKNK